MESTFVDSTPTRSTIDVSYHLFFLQVQVQVSCLEIIRHVFVLIGPRIIKCKHIYVNIEKSRPMTCFLKSYKRDLKKIEMGNHE